MAFEQIKEFRFQTRTYEWVEFKNVSLQPGHKTDVQVVVEKSKKTATSPPSRPRGSKLEFRIAPSPSAMEKAELASCRQWLKAGRVGFWWKGGRIAGRMPKHAWLPFAGELANVATLVTGEYQGRTYVLVSDKPGQVMLPGAGKGAWGLRRVYAVSDNIDYHAAIHLYLDYRGAELLTAITKANIGNALAMRDLMADLRAANPLGVGGGGKPFGRADRSRFLEALERMMRAAARD